MQYPAHFGRLGQEVVQMPTPPGWIAASTHSQRRSIVNYGFYPLLHTVRSFGLFRPDPLVRPKNVGGFNFGNLHRPKLAEGVSFERGGSLCRVLGAPPLRTHIFYQLQFSFAEGLGLA